MAELTANKYALPSGVAGGGTQDMVSGSWGEVAGVLTGPTNGTINAATSLRMQVGAVEAMHLDAARRLIHGKTVIDEQTAGTVLNSDGEVIITNSSVTGSALRGISTSGSYTGPVFHSLCNVSAGNSWDHFIGTSDLDGTPVDNIIIRGSGDLINTSNAYGAISARKLKTEFTPVSSQLEDVLKLGSMVQNYKLKSDIAENGNNAKRQIGLIADEVEKFCPGLVFEHNDTKQEKYKTPVIDKDGKKTEKFETATRTVSLGTTTKGITYSLIPLKQLVAFKEYVEKTDARLKAAGIA